jgi:hypothetical protein
MKRSPNVQNPPVSISGYIVHEAVHALSISAGSLSVVLYRKPLHMHSF